MAIAEFIPEVWSARILENLNKNLVYAELFNRDYEGEIRQAGDTVHIGSLGNVTVKTYTKDTAIDDPDQLEGEDQTLVIDQADYFNFAVDDIDKVQAKPDLVDEAARTTGYVFGDVTDTYLAGLLKSGTIKAGLGNDTTPLVVNSTDNNAYELLVDMAVAMTKANVPRVGRKVVVPPEFEGLMLKDDRFVKTAAAGAEERLANAVIARAAGFDILVSNNVPNTTNAKYKIIAATTMQGSFADQILETEAYRPEKHFADAVKGLHVYGAKVLRPGSVAVATINFTS